MNGIASGDSLCLNSIIGNNNGNKVKYITFSYYSGSRVSVANDDRTYINTDYKFPSSKSNCTILNEWHVTSVTCMV